MSHPPAVSPSPPTVPTAPRRTRALVVPPAPEVAGFFGGSAQPLFGVLHPAGRPAKTGVVVVPPFAEERKCAQRLLVLTARRLAAAGLPVLRADLRGTGDSLGTHGAATLAGWREDVAAAGACLRAQTGVERVVWLGARLGANLALQAAHAAGSATAGVMLWEPLLTGRDLLAEMGRRQQLRAMLSGGRQAGGADDLEAQWARGATVDFDGYAVSAALAVELRALELAPALAPLLAARMPLLLVRVTGAKTLPPAWAALETQVTGAGGTFQVLREKPFWGRLDYYEAEELIDATEHFTAPWRG